MKNSLSTLDIECQLKKKIVKIKEKIRKFLKNK